MIFQLRTVLTPLIPVDSIDHFIDASLVHIYSDLGVHMIMNVGFLNPLITLIGPPTQKPDIWSLAIYTLVQLNGWAADILFTIGKRLSYAVDKLFVFNSKKTRELRHSVRGTLIPFLEMFARPLIDHASYFPDDNFSLTKFSF